VPIASIVGVRPPRAAAPAEPIAAEPGANGVMPRSPKPESLSA